MFLALRKILQMHGPHLVFLCETKLMTSQMNGVCNKLNYENYFAVSSIGRGGGLAMLWNSDTNVQVQSFSKHHIDVEIQMDNGRQVRCTGVYGHPETRQKRHTWTLLRRLTNLSTSPWLCFGDFNKILHPCEKSGGNKRHPNLIHDFREALRDCDLLDVGFEGYPFTWSNGRYGPGFVKERPDRFMSHNT